jgi:trehalose 6-phosphate synthase
MRRLLIVSNRLPITVEHVQGRAQVRPSSGGLASALTSVFRHHSGAWIGWPGISSLNETLPALPSTPQVQLVPVLLTEQERQNFYYGFSNEIIWPLFHDLQSRCNFDPSYWSAYLEVNQKFKETVLEYAGPGDLVWVHDYHLALLGSMIRKEKPSVTTAYFQHIPFPSVDIFEKLPWADEMLRSLLSFSVIGFQTERDLRNFCSCVRHFSLGNVRGGKGHVLIKHESGASRAQAIPISVDFLGLEAEAKSEHVEEKLLSMKEEFGRRKVVLGLDRLDYTKGIPERLRSVARAFELYPELRRFLCFVQVVVPSRENIPKYQSLKLEVERLVSEINGRFTDGGWVPIHFIYRHLQRAELLAYYRLADVALITPLKDGMNLVAKEYCAADVDEDGMLVISQFAGAAEQLANHALSVNPNNYDQVAQQLHAAIFMDPNESRGRMSCMRALIRHFDVNLWVEAFLQASGFMQESEGPTATCELNRYFLSSAGQ